ncbi:hypothetical protein [Fictibacillus gelatini]|uniref:hypothetical protein n=1 Tax=Fictibacillus gelatini TaxID=225985 RepID=UPI0004241230|nr:hypothetical protein [Fictibacillus gelatini]
MDKENQSEKLPDTVAFNDKFTREFMDSPKEVREGYYLFKSKTGGYTMLYPKNANMDEAYYERHKDYYEAINFGESSKKDNISYYVRNTYEKGEITNDIDVNLNLLSDYIHYKGEYSKFNYDDKTIYFAKDTERVNDENNGVFYGFFSYIKSNSGDQAVRFFYDVTCLDEKQKCNIDIKKEAEKAKMLMESVKFKN